MKLKLTTGARNMLVQVLAQPGYCKTATELNDAGNLMGLLGSSKEGENLDKVITTEISDAQLVLAQTVVTGFVPRIGPGPHTQSLLRGLQLVT